MSKSDKLILKALRGEAVERTPVWLMRQAGRVLPEYRALKEEHGFVKMASTPDLAAEVTLQPIRRFGWDGAILFADILTPLMPLDFGIDFKPGPVFERPLQGREDLDRVCLPTAGSLDHVAEAIRLVKAKLPDHVTMLGFAGAPMTMAAYLLDGGGSREHAKLRAAIHGDPKFFAALMDKLADLTIEYLRLQIDAGIEAFQLFDTWAGILDETTYRRAALPAAQKIFAALADTVPRMYLIKDGSHLMSAMSEAGADALSLDWRTPLDQGRAFLGDQVPVQGNMDPGALLGTADSVRANVQDILDRNAGRPGHIFNLGHGLLPQTPIENLEVLKETVDQHATVNA
ncbi:MAG: uroporphyrinogen decarboxylase [Planctomycetes bacterium]|nr:uroporphyrinogen decarboxylase [Planctomycetota bacterium]